MTRRSLLLAALLGLSTLACGPKKEEVKVEQIRLNGISLGMPLADVEAKLGKGQQLFGGDRPMYDYKSITVAFNKEGKSTSVDGNSEFGDLQMEVDGTQFKSMPSGQMLGPAFGKARVEHQMQGSTYTYPASSIVIRRSADGRGHWGAQIHTATP